MLPILDGSKFTIKLALLQNIQPTRALSGPRGSAKGGQLDMPADDPSVIKSWITKARKGEGSAIEGRGVHAIEPIGAGEVVAVKGGHIVDGGTVAALPSDSELTPIAEDHFLAALSSSEYEGVMMLVNHSCEPNLGMAGNVVLVSMHDIAPGEELTIDSLPIIGDPKFSMTCRCGQASCREVISGADWRRSDLQARYRDWFSWYLARRIEDQ